MNDRKLGLKNTPTRAENSLREIVRQKITFNIWLCSVAVSTRDFDSRILGSNPSTASFFVPLVPYVRMMVCRLKLHPLPILCTVTTLK